MLCPNPLVEISKKLSTTDQIVEVGLDLLVLILTMTKLSIFKSVTKGQKMEKIARNWTTDQIMFWCQFWRWQNYPALNPSFLFCLTSFGFFEVNPRVPLLYYLLYNGYLLIRRPVPSTDQAIPSCFYFRISWILVEQGFFYFFCPLGFLEGLRSLKQWLLKKVSMKNLDQKYKFLIKK